MVKKALPIIIIALLLLSLAIIEIIFVHQHLYNIDKSVDELLIMYEENEDDIRVILPQLDKLKKDWKKGEGALCLMFNHRDVSMITDSISKLSSYTLVNDYEDAYTEVRLLKEYTQKSHKIMGFNIDNVF